jgi:hypothetical protein
LGKTDFHPAKKKAFFKRPGGKGSGGAAEEEALEKRGLRREEFRVGN